MIRFFLENLMRAYAIYFVIVAVVIFWAMWRKLKEDDHDYV